MILFFHSISSPCHWLISRSRDLSLYKPLILWSAVLIEQMVSVSWGICSEWPVCGTRRRAIPRSSKGGGHRSTTYSLPLSEVPRIDHTSTTFQYHISVPHFQYHISVLGWITCRFPSLIISIWTWMGSSMCVLTRMMMTPHLEYQRTRSSATYSTT